MKKELLALGMLAPLALSAQKRIAAPETPERKPNILYIVFDDMGWGDMGYNGGTLVPTPNFDRLAALGVTFSNGYVTAGTSCPSRNGLVTGCYQQRFGVQINADYRKAQIPDSIATLPETLGRGGYQTALVGKWHVCKRPETVFDRVYEPIEISSNYFPNAQGVYNGPRLPIVAALPAGTDTTYMTDRLTHYAIRFMEEAREPFFLYLGYNAVHNPWQADKKWYDRLSHIREEWLRVYASILASADENLGRVLDYLEQSGELERTVIVMMGDNGPAKAGPEIRTWDGYDPSRTYIFGSTGGLRGHKVDLYEGGVRQPMILSYPPRFRQGKEFRDMVSSMDFYPTVCELAGVEAPQGLDGVSLVRHLREETKQQPHDFLFWKRLHNGAVRMGCYKLVFDKERCELFSLRDDIGETTDLSDEYPHIRQKMLAAWEEWAASLPANNSRKPENPYQGE